MLITYLINTTPNVTAQWILLACRPSKNNTLRTAGVAAKEFNYQGPAKLRRTGEISQIYLPNNSEARYFKNNLVGWDLGN